MTRLRTQPAATASVICEAMVSGKYRVQVIENNGSPCWRVLIQEFGQWNKIRCFDDRDERNFPKSAARRGHELVMAIEEQTSHDVR